MIHYRQMEELLELLRDSLPDVPILMTTPPGSYESFRQRRRRRTYAINPRTVTAVNTIHDLPAAINWWCGICIMLWAEAARLQELVRRPINASGSRTLSA